jgi:(p)ppGpp synthase/HD superfamily hydrolase
MIKWNDRLLKARDFVRSAHDAIGQKRKYTGENYWVHPEAVAEIVSDYTDDENMIMAALAHDVLEDTQVTESQLLEQFPTEVVRMIVELTHIYTSEAYPNLNRAQRKELEAQRLSAASLQARIIKVADIIHNTRDIVANDPEFAKIYLKEKDQLIELIKHDVPTEMVETVCLQIC